MQFKLNGGNSLAITRAEISILERLEKKLWYDMGEIKTDPINVKNRDDDKFQKLHNMIISLKFIYEVLDEWKLMHPKESSATLRDLVPEVDERYDLLGLGTKRERKSIEESKKETKEESKPESKPEENNKEPTCPDCGSKIRHIAKYDRWYCEQCKKYLPKDFKHGEN